MIETHPLLKNWTLYLVPWPGKFEPHNSQHQLTIFKFSVYQSKDSSSVEAKTLQINCGYCFFFSFQSVVFIIINLHPLQISVTKFGNFHHCFIKSILGNRELSTKTSATYSSADYLKGRTIILFGHLSGTFILLTYLLWAT